MLHQKSGTGSIHNSPDDCDSVGHTPPSSLSRSTVAVPPLPHSTAANRGPPSLARPYLQCHPTQGALLSRAVHARSLAWDSEHFMSLLPRPNHARLSLQETRLSKWPPTLTSSRHGDGAAASSPTHLNRPLTWTLTTCRSAKSDPWTTPTLPHNLAEGVGYRGEAVWQRGKWEECFWISVSSWTVGRLSHFHKTEQKSSGWKWQKAGTEFQAKVGLYNVSDFQPSQPPVREAVNLPQLVNPSHIRVGGHSDKETGGFCSLVFIVRHLLSGQGMWTHMMSWNPWNPLSLCGLGGWDSHWTLHQRFRAICHCLPPACCVLIYLIGLIQFRKRFYVDLKYTHRVYETWGTPSWYWVSSPFALKTASICQCMESKVSKVFHRDSSPCWLQCFPQLFSWLDVLWVMDHSWYTRETQQRCSSYPLKLVHLAPTIPYSKALQSFVLPILPLNGTHTQPMSQLSQGLKIPSSTLTEVDLTCDINKGS